MDPDPEGPKTCGSGGSGSGFGSESATLAEDIDVYLEWLSVCVEEAQCGDAELFTGLLL
jgi:transcription elongation factor Elf1